MIVHEPLGIDDPYKRTPTERYPRDPSPGDLVSIGFATPPQVRDAWLDVRTPGGERRVNPSRLPGGAWLADLGQVDGGAYAYTLHAVLDGVEATSGPFGFEVSARRVARRLDGVDIASDRVTIHLDAEVVSTRAVLSFPLEGVCRIDFEAGDGFEAIPGGLPCQAERRGSALEIRAPGTLVSLDTETLALRVHAPGRSDAAYVGSLVQHWSIRPDGDVDQLEVGFEVRAHERLYGLGERFSEADRRGRAWDVRVYEEYKGQGDRTYLPVPMLVSNDAYGIWLDTEAPSVFDLSGERCTVQARQLPTSGMRVPLHVIVGQRPYDVTATFTRLTGAIAVPPSWAFGPWMSANTWNDQASAEQALQRTLAEDVPATVIVIEAWSDEATFYVFNDATYEPREEGAPLRAADFRFGGRWPDPKAFVDACHAAGVRVLLWQIPVHKRCEAPHAQHDLDEATMLERGYAILEDDGSPYRNKGWWFPGALVLDVTNPDARAWWFEKRRYLFDDIGIDGMKTDGGEHIWGRSLRANDGRRGMTLANVYSLLYTEAYYSFVQDATNGDGVIFSRAGYTGAQRFPAHWAGDEDSTWQAYRASVRAGLSAGVSGISMWSWDLGGFSGDVPGAELYLRSAAMAAFCPIMQYHSEGHGASDNRERTPWNVSERHHEPSVLETYRHFAKLRMRLLDHIDADARALAEGGLPMMRYPALEFPHVHDFLAEDPYTYLFGRDLLVAPVVEQGVTTRTLRLPPGAWRDLWSGATFEGPRSLTVPAPITRIPVFVRVSSPRADALVAAAAG